MTSRLRTTALSAVTILGVGAVTAVAVQPSSEPGAPPVTFHALSGSATTAAAIPERGQRLLKAMGKSLESVGGDVATNGRALTTGDGAVHELPIPSGGRVFLVVNGEHTCFLEDDLPSPAAGCARTENLTDARRLVTSITKESDSAWRVVALLPDLTTATVVRDDVGNAVPLQTSGNVGIARVRGIPAALSWTDASGSGHNQTVGPDA